MHTPYSVHRDNHDNDVVIAVVDIHAKLSLFSEAFGEEVFTDLSCEQYLLTRLRHDIVRVAVVLGVNHRHEFSFLFYLFVRVNRIDI